MSLPVPQAQAQPLPAPLVASTLRESDARVAAIAYRLARMGKALCPETHPLTGMLFHHLAEYGLADRALMIERYALNRGPGILTVLADTPAARAGLKAGDVLLTIGGQPLTSGAVIAAEAKRTVWRKRVEAEEARLEAALRQGPVPLKVLRAGQSIEVTLDSEPGCYGKVRLARSTQVNAFASGSTVIMTTAMLDFLKSDDEVAVVLGHELSHNILKHPDLLDDQGVPRKGIFRGIGKNASRVWKTEEEADRFGIRLVWRAGYDVNAAIPFWRRYLGRYDALPQIFRTHPSLSVRERITREEIAALAQAAPTP
ncbi:M48 family metallopeptidase [Allosphingosinicella deserti]|uniref:M48 family metallopeptidase n=1 Tax=Allosphingosinicella deserti TaxID=2116704 RepID=UPI001305053C|nr:M48 family metallopeptidase [Sphingomonas deserti]